MSAAPPRAARAARAHALAEPGYRAYLAGFGASLLADGLWFVALAWAAARLGDPVRSSLVLAAGSVPRAALLLFGGAVADRLGPLAVVLRTQACRLGLLAAFTASAFVSRPSVVLLVVTATAFGVLDALHMPAAAALPPLLLERADLPGGQGMVQTVERLALVVASGLGGLLIAVAGLPGIGTGAVLLLAIALPLFRSLRGHPAPHREAATDPEERSLFVRSVLDGVRLAVRHPVIGPVLLVVTIVNLTLMPPLNVGLPLVVRDHGWTAATYGLLLALFGAGAAVGSLSVLRWRPSRPALGGMAWIAFGAAALAVLGAAPTTVAAGAAAALLGLSAGPSSALLLGLVQSLTPSEHMAKVMALIAFSALGLTPVGYLAFGAVAARLGPGRSFLVFAAADLLVVVVALTSRPLRRARL